MMNDYFLRSLILQRHVQILAEVRAAQLLRLKRFRVTRANRSIGLVRTFLARLKNAMFVQPAVAEEGKRG